MFHLLRYFCEAGKADSVYRDYGGLINPPEESRLLSERSALSTQMPWTWEFYSKYRSIVLLGPARQGKTIEFKFQCGQVQHGFFLPLRDFTDQNSPAEAIQDFAKWQVFLGSGEKGELFIDALDEGRIEAKNVINHLTKWIRRLGNEALSRLRVHISCRSADWVRADRDKWLGLFLPIPEESDERTDQSQEVGKGCIVLELLDLTRNEIEEFCRFRQVDPDRFLPTLPRELLPLVARPQTLGFLLEDYVRSPDDFPTGAQELYERIIEKRLLEHNEIYESAGIPHIGPYSKRFIAEHYALTCSLTGREIIAPQGSDSSCEVPGELSGRGLVEEKETFKTDIFQVYNHVRFRFNEPELAEYFAAKKLDHLIADRIIQSKRVISLFFLLRIVFTLSQGYNGLLCGCVPSTMNFEGKFWPLIPVY